MPNLTTTTSVDAFLTASDKAAMRAAMDLGTSATHASTDFDVTGSAVSALTTPQTFTPTQQAQAQTNISAKSNYGLRGLRTLKKLLNSGLTNIDVLLVSDSTGVGAGDTGHLLQGWYGRLSEGIATRYPSSVVEGTVWNTGNASFQSYPTNNPVNVIQSQTKRLGAKFVSGNTSTQSVDYNAANEAITSGNKRIIIDFTCDDAVVAVTQDIHLATMYLGSPEYVCQVEFVTWEPHGTPVFFFYDASGVQKAAIATTPITFVNGQRYLLDIWLEVDNGSSGFTVHFRSSIDGGFNWVNNGDVVTAGTTSTKSTFSLSCVGSTTAVNPFGLTISRIEIYDGISKYQISPVSAESNLYLGDSTYPSRDGSPVIRFRNASVGGYSVLSWNAIDPRIFCGKEPTSLVIIALNYNEARATREYYTSLVTLITSIKSQCPMANIVLSEQCPRAYSASNSIQCYITYSAFLDDFAARNGCEVLKIYDRFAAKIASLGLTIDDVTTDGLHCNPLGYDIWGNLVLDSFDQSN